MYWEPERDPTENKWLGTQDTHETKIAVAAEGGAKFFTAGPGHRSFCNKYYVADLGSSSVPLPRLHWQKPVFVTGPKSVRR